MTKLFESEITGDKKPITNLYELMGLSVNPYRAKTLPEYKASLYKMTYADLQDHAQDLGVPAFDDKERMINALLDSFAQTMGGFEAAIAQAKEADAALSKPNDLNETQQQQVANLLSKGR